MIPDIFSSFDPSSYNSIIPSITIIFIINIFYLFIIDRTTRPIEINRSILTIPILKAIVPEVKRTYIFNINPLNHIIHQMFFIVVVLNMIGLIPYTFRVSRHLLFTLSIGLPM